MSIRYTNENSSSAAYEPFAFVLLNAVSGKDTDLLEQLRNNPNVKEAHKVYGPYDIMAEIKASDMDNLKAIMIKIRESEYVQSTLTSTVVDGKSK